MAVTDTPRKARHGEKMIEVRLRFFTNSIAGEGEILPKHAWTNGMSNMQRNATPDIVPGEWLPFNSLMEIPTVIERLLLKQGIELHLTHKMSKYIV